MRDDFVRVTTEFYMAEKQKVELVLTQIRDTSFEQLTNLKKRTLADELDRAQRRFVEAKNKAIKMCEGHDKFTLARVIRQDFEKFEIKIMVANLDLQMSNESSQNNKK